MTSNAQGFATLDDWIKRLETLPDGVKAIAQELAPEVKAVIDEQIAQGVGPDGQAWKPKKDGGRALVNAAKAVTAKAIDNVILITLSGKEVFHQWGTRRVPQRAILPTGGLPAKLGNAIRLGIVDGLDAWLSRAGRHDKPRYKK
jgi:hypothetical protein